MGMRSKTIKSVLRRKLDSFVKSIEDENVRELVKNNTIITGGSIASMLLGEPVNDYDLYFRNKETAMAVAQYYTRESRLPDGFNKSHVEIQDRDDRIFICVGGPIGTPDDEDNVEGEPVEESEDKLEYRVRFVSSNAITLTDKIQLIVRFYGEPDDIHKNYDFVHCTNFWKSWDGGLFLRAPAMESLLARELVYVGSKYPFCSIVRTRKFIKRGWKINAGQYLKMVLQAAELDWNSLEVLEDQLVGVDTTYFMQLLGELGEFKNSGTGSVDTAKIIQIVNKYF